MPEIILPECDEATLMAGHVFDKSGKVFDNNLFIYAAECPRMIREKIIYVFQLFYKHFIDLIS